MTHRLVVGPQRVRLVVVDHGPDRTVRLSTGMQGPTGPQGNVGPAGPPGSGGVWFYDAGSSAYVLSPTTRIFVQQAGDPPPTMAADDIHLVESP